MIIISHNKEFFPAGILLFILFFITVMNSSLLGQCPDRDSLWNKVYAARNSSDDDAKNLGELLRYKNELKNCPVRIDSGYTFLLVSIGATYYWIADYVHAIEYTRQAIDLIQTNANRPYINKRNLIDCYYYLSIYYDSLKLFNEKNEAIDSCIANDMRANTNHHRTSLVLQQNVRDLYNRGDYKRCIDRATLGEMLVHKFYEYSNKMDVIIYFIYYKASAYRSMGNFEEEEKFLETKRTEFREIKNKDYLAYINQLYGELCKAKGQYKPAIDYFQKAFNYDIRSEKKELSSGLLSGIGLIYAGNLNQPELALQYYKQAADIATPNDSLDLLTNIANVYVSMKRFDSAYLFYQRSFNKIKKGIKERDIVFAIDDYIKSNNTAAGVVKLISDKAYAHLQHYYFTKDKKILQQASSAYRTADLLLNRIRTVQAEVESKLFWRSYARKLYEHAIETSYLENNMEDAFYFFEKSRAVLLSDQLNEQSKIADDDFLKQAELKKKKLAIERTMDTLDISSNKYIDLQKDLISNDQEIEKFRLNIKKTNPLYFQSFFDTSFVSVIDIKQRLLKDHQAFVEMFEGDGAVYTLMITALNTYFGKIDRADYDSTVKKYTTYISGQNLLNKDYQDYTTVSHHLYQLIFQNVPVPNGRIIISPDNKYFPFESLMTTESASPVLFLNDHAVSYTYSARFLLTDFASSNSENTGNFFGMAPVQFAAGFSLAALHGSEQSLNKIGSYFDHANILVADHATRRNFLQQFSKYQIIQLYTHAEDSSTNGEPVIFFADSALHLSELIAENKTWARLIVLSACETGNGKLYQGEGVFSFNRGFASLGIPSSITNLWSVDNTSTYKLTELFYKYLSEGMPVDIALQKAKLKFISASREHRLPYYWAATIVAGKTEIFGQRRKTLWIDIPLIALIICGVSFFKWRKPRANPAIA